MTGVAQGETPNADYLAKALDWLTLLLDRDAEGGRRPEAAPGSAPAAPPAAQGLFHRRSTGPLSPPSPAVLVTDTSVDHELIRAAEEMAEASKCEPRPALLELADRLGMSPFERNTLLLCVGVELRPAIANLCARARSGGAEGHATFALAIELFERFGSEAEKPAWEAFSANGPLRYWRLIEIFQPGARSLVTSPLRADERIVNYVMGLNQLDDRLALLAAPLDPRAGWDLIPGSQAEVVEEILRQWNRAPSTEAIPVAQLVGPDAASKELVAWKAAEAYQARLYRLSADVLPASISEIEDLSRLWRREGRLLPLALYLDAQESDPSRSGEGGAGSSVARFLARTTGPIFLASREPWPRAGRASLAFDVARPTNREQAAAWSEELSSGDGFDRPADPDVRRHEEDRRKRIESIAGELAGQFDLNLETIHQVTDEALIDLDRDRKGHAAYAEAGPVLRDRLWDGCRASVRPRLDALAHRIDVKASFDDIVLPPASMALLRQVVAQVRFRSTVYEEWGFAAKLNRGLGIGALFAGESGTGKTMAAEVLAHALRLDLYRIDLSAVVSKYIGETEKNLRRLFDAAEDGAAILFFDEADALFGKRSEVKDSHDRYANIEIDYLLQRIESFRGLAILATNMKLALDTAFLRRLRFVIDFPFPGPPERKKIWMHLFPAVPHGETRPHVPVGPLDYDALAKLDLTGGSILNVALCATFLAARDGGEVTMPLIFEALRSEYLKLGRPINEEFFRTRTQTAAGVAR